MLLFFFDFWSPWALQGMGSYAISTRRRSENSLFHFRTFSKKELPKDLIWGPFWGHFWATIWFFCEKRGFKNCLKKRSPARRKRYPIPLPEGSWAAASCARCLNKKQLFEQQKARIWARVPTLVEIVAKKLARVPAIVEIVAKNVAGCWYVWKLIIV